MTKSPFTVERVNPNELQMGNAPPDDELFKSLLYCALQGHRQVPVYEIIFDIGEAQVVRAFDSHRPEQTDLGAMAVQAMIQAWAAGDISRPWLYVKDDKYIVADNYHWIAMVEQINPGTVGAIVLGEPLEKGLVEKNGPFDRNTVSEMLFGAP